MRVCPECGTRTEEGTCPVDGLVTFDESLLETEDPLAGRQIGGKYEIIEEIGAGGMGSVYRARHTETGGLVAIKVMAASRAERPTAIKRFHLEAQNAAVLRHANSVRVLDFGVDDGLLYLAMEYLAGAPLSAVLREEGALPWARAAHIAKQVLKALWEAHEHPRRIVHRDIKPANIFLCEQVGDPDFVKVVDFGVARSMEGDGAGTKGAIGTPGAMAPEQWSGGGDARSDLYSVGCLIYEMLVGHPPFVVSADSGDRLMQLAHMHMNQVPNPLMHYVPNVPIGVARLTHALLEKDPKNRPQSAREAVTLLDKALYGDPLEVYADCIPDIAPVIGDHHVARAPTISLSADSRDIDLMGETATFGDDVHATNESAGFPPLSAAPPPQPPPPQPSVGSAGPQVTIGDAASTQSTPTQTKSDKTYDRKSLVDTGFRKAFGSGGHDPVARTIEIHEKEASGGETSDMLEFLRARHDSGLQKPIPIPGADEGDDDAGGASWEEKNLAAITAAPNPTRASSPPAPDLRSSAPDARRSSPRTRAHKDDTNKRFPLGWVVVIAVCLGAGGWFFWAKSNNALPPVLAKMFAPKVDARVAAEEPDVPDAPPLDITPPDSPDEENGAPKPDLVYRARLGAKDHKNAAGRSLRRAADVLLRDRENFHAGVRDIDDGDESQLSDPKKRAQLKKLLGRALTREKSLAILRGRPLVEVQMWADYAAVAILESKKK